MSCGYPHNIINLSKNIIPTKLPSPNENCYYTNFSLSRISRKQFYSSACDNEKSPMIPGTHNVTIAFRGGDATDYIYPQSLLVQTFK